MEYSARAALAAQAAQQMTTEQLKAALQDPTIRDVLTRTALRKEMVAREKERRQAARRAKDPSGGGAIQVVRTWSGEKFAAVQESLLARTREDWTRDGSKELGPCKLFEGALNGGSRGGYAEIRITGTLPNGRRIAQTEYIHRVLMARELTRSTPHVLHRCHGGRDGCINPQHLAVGTQSDSMSEAAARRSLVKDRREAGEELARQMEQDALVSGSPGRGLRR